MWVGKPLSCLLSVALPAGTPLCSYGISYGRGYGLSTSELFKKSLCSPLCGPVGFDVKNPSLSAGRVKCRLGHRCSVGMKDCSVQRYLINRYFDRTSLCGWGHVPPMSRTPAREPNTAPRINPTFSPSLLGFQSLGVRSMVSGFNFSGFGHNRPPQKQFRRCHHPAWQSSKIQWLQLPHSHGVQVPPPFDSKLGATVLGEPTVSPGTNPSRTFRW